MCAVFGITLGLLARAGLGLALFQIVTQGLIETLLPVRFGVRLRICFIPVIEFGAHGMGPYYFPHHLGHIIQARAWLKADFERLALLKQIISPAPL